MTEAKCADDPVSRSICMIRLALDDVGKRSGGLAGGGISAVRAKTSTSYQLSLPREEAVDVVTYSFEVAPGMVRLTGRTEATESR